MKTKTNVTAYMLLLIAVSFGFWIYGAMGENIVFILVGIILLFLSIYVKNNEKVVFFAIILSWLTLEVVYFNLFGGTFRISFLCSLLMIVIFIPALAKTVLYSNLKWVLLLFLYMFAMAIFSENIVGAVKSSFYLMLNAGVAFVAFVFIYTGKIDEYEFPELLRKAVTFCVIFGLFQWLVYRGTGIVISLDPASATGQLKIGQIPGFRTEANVHGKMICWAIVFSLPPVFYGVNKKKYRRLLILALTTLALSMTRSALYAMIITIIFMILWYLKKRRKNIVIKIALGVILVFSAILLVLASGILGDSYSLYKIQNMFLTSVDDIKSDGSAGFRYQSFTVALDIWNQSWKNRIIGVGYGQTWASLQGVLGETRAGGCDILAVLAGTGIIGLLIFMMFNVRSWVQDADIWHTNEVEIKVFSEQLLFCGIFGFCICIFSGILQCPEYWVILGCSAAIFLKRRTS